MRNQVGSGAFKSATFGVPTSDDSVVGFFFFYYHLLVDICICLQETNRLHGTGGICVISCPARLLSTKLNQKNEARAEKQSVPGDLNIQYIECSSDLF